MEQFNSLVVQMVKNLSTVRSSCLGQKGPLEKVMATYSSILLGESPGQRSQAGYSPWGHKESDRIVQLTLSHSHTHTNTVLSCIYYP